MITHPLIDYYVFAGFVGILVLIGAFLCYRWGGQWRGERDRVRQAVCQQLRLPPDEAGVETAGNKILALVPSQAVSLEGRLGGLMAGGRAWLCFLADRMLVIADQTGDCISVGRGELRDVVVREPAEAAGYVLSFQTEGVASAFRIERLEDVIRVLHVAQSLEAPVSRRRVEAAI